MKGRFNVRGKVEIQFWLRAFQLEAPIKHAQNTIMSTGAESAMVPIISEYECGRIYWQMILVPKVDALGLVDGEGKVWMSDNLQDRDAQVEECAELANDLLEGVPVSESWKMETPKER